jgi:hypothetical protein
LPRVERQKPEGYVACLCTSNISVIFFHLSHSLYLPFVWGWTLLCVKICMTGFLITSWTQSHDYELRFLPKQTNRVDSSILIEALMKFWKVFFNQTLWHVMAMINMHTWNINSFVHCNTDASHLCTLPLSRPLNNVEMIKVYSRQN